MKRIKHLMTGLLLGVLLLGLQVGSGFLWATRDSSMAGFTVAEAQSTMLPVLCYQNVTPGGEGKNAISTAMLEQDLQYLTKKGYRSVSASQIQSYLAGEGTLPQKPFVLLFSGGYAGVYEQAFSLLQEYETCAVVSIVGKYTDLYSYTGQTGENEARLSWNQLYEMMESNLLELANQTYELEGQQDGLVRQANQSVDEYSTMVQQDVVSLSKLMEQEIGVESDLFVYACGQIDNDLKSALGEVGFSLIFTNQETTNFLAPNMSKGALPVSLSSFLRYHDDQSKQWFDTIGLK